MKSSKGRCMLAREDLLLRALVMETSDVGGGGLSLISSDSRSLHVALVSPLPARRRGFDGHLDFDFVGASPGFVDWALLSRVLLWRQSLHPLHNSTRQIV
ncbi:hypothetical protein IGI04_035182 [Brassica rapa subsp. trilocularis]|uniref:Uncharacterized protein n=1 Tax=Brassica rapa subsp. trilocularis TaxID=1813537 RepID=A0ABQ7LBU8_BRACM|nr:hypothetical protein IGI04_035182 [Brassica rapa subsp. trilocularis]